jgi:hypothetical protein
MTSVLEASGPAFDDKVRSFLKRSRSTWSVVGWLLVAGAGTVIGAWYFSAHFHAEDELSLEFGKLFLQFLMVSGLGALLAALFELMRSRKDKAERERAARNEILDDILKRTVETYQEVKRIRRRGRLEGEQDVSAKEFRQTMLDLNEQQLVFERLKRTAEGLERSVPAGHGGPNAYVRLRESLEELDFYLDRICGEYERVAEAGAPTPGLPQWNQFLGHSSAAVAAPTAIDQDEIEASFEDFKLAYVAVRRTVLAAKLE